MVFNNEIRIRNECKRKGLDPDEVLQLMQVQYEWTENGLLFHFESIPGEKLSHYIDYIFKKLGYHLDEGTPLNGSYSHIHLAQVTGKIRIPLKYSYITNIHSNEGKTYLELSFGKYLKSDLNKIVGQIIFLKPSIKGFLVCNKCGAYYEVHKVESSDVFSKNCECGGIFEYIASPKQPDEEHVERKRTARPTEYLRVPVALIIVSSACIGSMNYNPSIIAASGVPGLGFGMIFLLIRDKSQELIFSMIFRRLIYFLAAILFFVEGWTLFNVWLQSTNSVILRTMSLIFVIISSIFGFSMIFKLISPENPQNFLDPPL